MGKKTTCHKNPFVRKDNRGANQRKQYPREMGTIRTRSSTIYFFFLLLAASIIIPTFAEKKTYVVYLGAHSRKPGVELSAIEYDGVREAHYSFLGSFLGSHEQAQDAIFYSYTRHINGFAATLDEAEAAEIAKHPEVISVFLNQERQLHTTRSWDFLGLENNGEILPSSAWNKARFGEDTIIANIDTGVWPESKSFSDDGIGPIPAKWKGICQNDQDPSFQCNRKLIGARYFNKAYSQVHPLNSTANSPRDNEGHGSHTLSTAGGNFVAGASLFGVGNGTAAGGSPKARVATYKVCWPPVMLLGGCFDADILAAFDVAIDDGVDVISVSLGADGPSLLSDPVAIGSFHAAKHGIVVVCSAGNSGTEAGTVTNIAPWVITVGASTMDRMFPSDVVLGNNMRIRGQSFSEDVLPNNESFPIVSAISVKVAGSTDENAELCYAGSLDPSKAKGKILVCLRGGICTRVGKGQNAASAGAVGMVLTNSQSDGNEVISDPHVLPATHISYTDGVALLSYINSSTSPMAYITPPVTELGIKPAPVMAAFSSRGPNPSTPEILKPDITAPGVNVIAAYTEAKSPGENFDTRRVPYNALSGTSMSCPHVSGIVGLLKTLHPDWSPAAIKSAIMTTARTRDNAGKPLTDASQLKATPFSYGAGHIRPTRAMDPGLVYDLTTDDYLGYLCALGYNQSQIALFTNGTYTCPSTVSLINLNYPSITVPNLNDTITVTRTVKNVGSSPATYNALTVNPPGLSIDVQPKSFTFANIGEEKTFNITIATIQVGAAKDYVFGTLTWSDGDGKHEVRSPIVVKSFN